MEEQFEFLDAHLANGLSTQAFQDKHQELLKSIKQQIVKAAKDDYSYETELTVDRDKVNVQSLRNYLEQFHYTVKLMPDQSSRGQKIFITINWSNAHEY